MDAKVKLSDIFDTLEMQSDESSYYLDTRTGTVYLLTPDEPYAGEEDDLVEDYPEWQRETIEIARRLANGADENLIELPTQWDVNEYQIMQDFCDAHRAGSAAYRHTGQRGFQTVQGCRPHVRHRR